MKTAVVTGATAGIGFAVAHSLLTEGWRILLVGRTEENCLAAQKALTEDFPNAALEIFFADMSLMSETKRVADEISSFLKSECDGKLDALINNAGAVRSKRTVTDENFEFQFALNYLSAFMLSKQLLPYLEKAKGAVVSTGSNSHIFARKMRWNNIMLQCRYNSLRAYAQSKLALMLFSAEAQNLFGEKVCFYVVDPGVVRTEIGSKNTKGLTNLFWFFRKRQGVDPMIPAQTYVHLLQERPQEMYFFGTKPQKQSKASKNMDEAKKLFLLSEHLCEQALTNEK